MLYRGCGECTAQGPGLALLVKMPDMFSVLKKSHTVDAPACLGLGAVPAG